MTESVSSHQPNLTFYWVRLIMNRHLYGPLHGPPLEDTAATHRNYNPVHKVVTTTSSDAKIIDNELYVHSITEVRIDRKRGGTTQSLRTSIDVFGPTMACRHTCARVRSVLGRDEESSKPFRLTPGVLSSCDVCFTDYQIRISVERPPARTAPRFFQRQPPMEDEEWSIEVARWHNLGACRSPDDPKWVNVVTASYIRTRVERRAMCGAGMVHRVWMEGGLGSAHAMEGARASNNSVI
ncbi:hypothetical protein OQA88_7931 [Cercophora sp. LCS_1]